MLVNLGTPEAPTAAALKPYLKQFLSDPRVVEIPRLVWNPILHGIILNTRPKQSAAKYAKIWTSDGSPLKVHTHQQTQLLRGYIGDRYKSPLLVDYAMRYGSPSIWNVMQSLVQQQCDRILVFPLFPQYSASATASIFDEVYRFLRTLRNVPAVRTIKNFHDDPRYIKALAQSVRDYWMKNGRTKKLIMSFHGMPKFSLLKGDPYHCQCQKTGRLLAEELGLDADQYLITFQSRFGRAEWLKPYTATTLQELGTQKLERVDVICPGFISDCLETLEEIAIENKAIFLKAGGGAFHYIPCLNERPEWMHALTDITIDNLHGWISAEWDAAAANNELKTSRLRAQALGAKE